MAFVYTELYREDFTTQQNQSTIDPTKWLNDDLGPTPTSTLQVLNGVATTSTYTVDLGPPLGIQGGDGQALYLPVLPADQYVEIVVDHIQADTGGAFTYLRAGGNVNLPLAPCYIFDIGTFGGITSFDVYQIDSTGGAIPHQWVFFGDFVFPTLVKGDTFRFSILGNYATGKLYVDRNGVNVWSGNLVDSPSYQATGKSGMQLFSLSTPPVVTDVGISRFSAGSVSANPIWYPHYAPQYFQQNYPNGSIYVGANELAEVLAGDIAFAGTFKNNGNFFVINNPGRTA